MGASTGPGAAQFTRIPATLFADPRHPYTQALLSAAPIPDPVAEAARTPIILGTDLPSPFAPPSGCVFRTAARLPNPTASASSRPSPAPIPTRPPAIMPARICAPMWRRSGPLRLQKIMDRGCRLPDQKIRSDRND
ncbi:oligopeptide/dipeptide ABC transporter ATP-binding protein [Polymorphobacter sp.]|uniref:oligopeptide/dipeptide ABC transporter ATP-binding protein n=1 Tax=Polymorphobacter sp. TaxID=1909290 RepID=UPI003F71D353